MIALVRLENPLQRRSLRRFHTLTHLYNLLNNIVQQIPLTLLIATEKYEHIKLVIIFCNCHPFPQLNSQKIGWFIVRRYRRTKKKRVVLRRTFLSIYPEYSWQVSSPKNVRKLVGYRRPPVRQEFSHLMRWRRRPLPKPQVLSGASGLQTCECLSVSMSVCHNARATIQYRLSHTQT